jgi:hypothetical protein
LGRRSPVSFYTVRSDFRICPLAVGGPRHTCRRPTGDGAAHLRFLFFLRCRWRAPRPPGIPPRPAAAGMADRSFGPSRHPPPCVVFEVASLGVSRGPHVRPASTRTTRSAPPFAGRWAARAGTGAQPSRAPRVGDTRRETVTVCSLVAAGR